MNAPIWTVYLSALLTPVIAIFAAYIAWRQSKTAREKLRLDLFDRRYAVFAATHKTIIEVAQRGEATVEVREQFLNATRGGRWLFDALVAAYLDQMLHRMKEIDSLYDYIADDGGDPSDPSTAKLIEERTEHIEWFNDQLQVVEAVFADHMQLSP